MIVWSPAPARTGDGTIHFEGRAMASPLALQVADAGEVDAAGGWREVVEEFVASDTAMSRFRADSEVTALNRAALTGASFEPTTRLRLAVHAADRAHRVTGGHFDPRVVGLLDGWGYRGTPLDIDAASDGVGSTARIVARVDCERILLPHPIDLGGIGKGLALRWASDRLARVGVGRYLLDAGGDIVARGPAPSGGPWSVGIEDPRGGDAPMAVMAIVDGAVATSSVKRLRWRDDRGRPRHHIVDPGTRHPADGGLSAVTVMGSDPAWAEVWSKALFVAGRARIAALGRARGLAAWWVATDGALEMTPAARARTTWVAGEA